MPKKWAGKQGEGSYALETFPKIPTVSQKDDFSTGSTLTVSFDLSLHPPVMSDAEQKEESPAEVEAKTEEPETLSTDGPVALEGSTVVQDGAAEEKEEEAGVGGGEEAEEAKAPEEEKEAEGGATPEVAAEEEKAPGEEEKEAEGEAAPEVAAEEEKAPEAAEEPDEEKVEGGVEEEKSEEKAVEEVVAGEEKAEEQAEQAEQVEEKEISPPEEKEASSPEEAVESVVDEAFADVVEVAEPKVVSAAPEPSTYKPWMTPKPKPERPVPSSSQVEAVAAVQEGWRANPPAEAEKRFFEYGENVPKGVNPTSEMVKQLADAVLNA